MATPRCGVPAHEPAPPPPVADWWRVARAFAPVVAALLLTSAAFAAAVVVLAGGRPTPGGPGAPRAGSAPPSAASPLNPAPARELASLHQALHAIARACSAASGAASPSAVVRPTDVVLGFARRYPVGRITIDDESGSVQSLLLGVRADLRECDPAQAARVDRELSASMRDGTPSTP